MKKIIIILLVLSLALVGCSIETEKEVVVGRSEGNSVTELNIVSRGKNIDDFQLGFSPPETMTKTPEDFVGWLLFYDSQAFDAVWEELSDFSIENIKDISKVEGENRGYLVENFNWADGLGNTLNKDQKTFLEGKPFELGQYHFYVATVQEEGVTGLISANEIIDVRPVPERVELNSKDRLYSVTYNIQADERLKGHILFLSSKDLYTLKAEVVDLSLKDLEKISKNKQAILVSEADNQIDFDLNLKTFEGNKIEKDVYGVYVASYGEHGILDIAMANTFLVTAETPAKPETIINDGMGTVMLIGGGVASSDSDKASIFNAMLEAAGGNQPKLAILSSSREDSNAAYNHYYFKNPEFGSFEENYAHLGFEPVFIPLATDNADKVMNDTYWSALLASCDGAYLQGGDQYKHVKSLMNSDGTPSKMLLALQSILDRGGVVAGTSAGMAAMGETAFGYGYSMEALSHNAMDWKTIADIPVKDSIVSSLPDNNLGVPGIGLIDPAILLDTHFDKRGRLGRLLVAMRDTESAIAIGVDEGTSFNIQNKIGEVVGDQGVFILDGTDAVFSSSGADNQFSVENVYLHYLTDGDHFDLWTKKAMQSDAKLLVEGAKDYNSTHQIFGSDYETTKLLIDFIQSEDTLLEMPYKLMDETIMTIAFTKTDKTSGYTSNLDYVDPALEGYKKASIEHLVMSVYPFKGVDSIPPVISYMKGYTKPYKVYLGITDNLSGIDEATVNKETVHFISTGNTLYEPPFYDEAYQEIGIIIAEDAFVAGDMVKVEGVMDLSGNSVEPQTWIFDGKTWQKK